MLVSATGSSPHGHVDFDVLGGRLKGMAASVTHEFTEPIKGAELLLHGSPLYG